MPVATTKKKTTAAKKTTVKSPAKKAVAAKKPATKKPVAKKVTAKKTPVVRTPQRSDDELKALAERLWSEGITAPHAMSKATRGTSEFVLSRRFIKIAQAVIDSHGGKPVGEKKTVGGAKVAAATVERLNGMKAEYEAIKKWKAGGMKGDSPKTPLIDAKNAELAAKNARAAKQLATKQALASVHTAKKVAKKTAKKVAVA
jgi:hypothetical protein